MASWAEDQERGQAYDELLREEPGFMPDPLSIEEAQARLRRALDGADTAVAWHMRLFQSVRDFHDGR